MSQRQGISKFYTTQVVPSHVKSEREREIAQVGIGGVSIGNWRNREKLFHILLIYFANRTILNQKFFSGRHFFHKKNFIIRIA